MEMDARRPFTGLRTVLLLVLALGAPVAAAETLKIGGTGAALGSMRKLGDEFAKTRPDVRIEVLPYIGSTGAIKGVATGAINVGLSGRPAKADEQALDLSLVRYALTPLVLAGHPGNGPAGLTRAQLAAIYAGLQTRWDDGGPIRLILRPARETDNDVLRVMSAEMGAALDAALERKGIHMAPTDQDAADALERTPGALGTTTLSLLVSENRKLKVLALDGVVPSVKALAAGTYPYHKPLYLVIPRAPSPAVKGFLDFVRSPRGQAILIENAQLPVKS